MQSSMWKLLTAAGIIGIGTLVVLEVQNRLPMASRPNAEAAKASGTVPSADADVTPDATVDFDRMLAGSEAVTDPQFALHEPNPLEDSGVAVSPAEDQKFVGVTPVNRTVLKDSLTDDGNSFESSLDSAHAPEPADTSSVAESNTRAASTIQRASFTSESAPAKDTKTQNPSPTQFFNGGKDMPIPAATAKTAPVAVPRHSKIVTQASAQEDSDESPLPARVAAVTAAQNAPESRDLFLPDEVPEIGNSPNPATSGGIPPGEEPLMEMPEFATDPLPNLDAPADAANSSNSPAKAMPFKADGKPLNEVATPAKIADNLPVSSPDELVPTPPLGNPEAKPEADLEPSEVFQLDPVPTLEDSPVSGGSTPELGRTDTPPNSRESDFPEPSYPDEKSVPRLLEEKMFDSPSKILDGSESSLNLPAVSDPPARTNPERSGLDKAGNPDARSMSEVMRPQLSIEKRAPETATVGVSHEYTIVVSNDGDSKAYDVIVDDELGNGAKLENSKPSADFDRVSGKLTWTIRELAPHAKQEILVRITPTGEGTLDGVATVRFKAQVKSATVITAPKLTLEVLCSNEVKVGDDVQLRYVIRNNGSGDASHVILRSVLPPGLKHSEGGDLEYEIENLAAGDRKEIDLTVVAAEPGRIRTVSEVTASGVSADKAMTDIDIIGSQLTIQRLGPERRFVGRRAKFQNIVANETNFEATNAIVTELVPDGMKFISADNGGEYNPQTGHIRWELLRLASGKQVVLEVELEAESAGQRQTVVEVVEEAGFRSQATENTMVTVTDYENMTANISRQDAPVSIGETFGFTITIENRGTAVARNVEMVIDVPAEITVKAAGTRTIPARRTGNAVRYAIVPEIQPAEKMTFELKLQGEQAAQNALVQASLKYEQMTEPLIVSESVTIFDDRP